MDRALKRALDGALSKVGASSCALRVWLTETLGNGLGAARTWCHLQACLAFDGWLEAPV
jgi:hypothetical protein